MKEVDPQDEVREDQATPLSRLGRSSPGSTLGSWAKRLALAAKVIGFMGFRLTSLVRSSSSSLWSVKPHIGGALNLRCLALG